MSDPLLQIDAEDVLAATAALGEQILEQAEEQQGYLHSFPDGRISLELEWVDPQQWVHAAVRAYLVATRNK